MKLPDFLSFLKLQPASKADDSSQSDVSDFVKDSLTKPFRFSIDTVDACNLRCVICPRGVNYKNNTSKRMSLDVFELLLNKITAECTCNDIELHNWTEPFLNPQLDKFVTAAGKKGIGCTMSSNLSFNNPGLLEAVLIQNPALIVSVSGFEQKTHELYHKGSNVERVKENLRFIVALREKHNLKFHVEVHCLQFVDNENDQLMWGQFCKEHDFIFVARPAYGGDVATPETSERLITKPGFEELPDGQFRVKRNFSKTPVQKPCSQHNTIPLACNGDVYLCCIYWNTDERKIGNIFDTSIKEIQRKRFSHHDCAYCDVLRK